jgi:hypothetical protein
MSISVQDAVRDLLRIVAQLQATYPKKRFTLDGRLIGDLGETLVEGAYDVELFEGLEKHHDGKSSDGRLVQIKATMQRALTFPGDHVPDYYLGIKIHRDGTFSEIFNGPGRLAAKAIENRQLPKTNLHSISITALERLNVLVSEKDRIPKRFNQLSATKTHHQE